MLNSYKVKKNDSYIYLIKKFTQQISPIIKNQIINSQLINSCLYPCKYLIIASWQLFIIQSLQNYTLKQNLFIRSLNILIICLSVIKVMQSMSMSYALPYILTFFITLGAAYQLSVFGFIHKDLSELFQLSKMQLGYVYGISAIATTIGTIIMFFNSKVIKQRIISYFTYGCCLSIFLYSMLVFISLFFKLFVANLTILQSIHQNIIYVLPAFYYSIGFKGNEGYLLAIYCFFVTMGSYTLSFVDYGIEKIKERIQKEKNQNNQLIQADSQKRDNYESESYLIMMSISLILSLVMEVIISIDTIKVKEQGQNLRQQMVKLCLLGFFFGGPLNSYVCTRILNCIQSLENSYIDEYHQKFLQQQKQQKEQPKTFLNSTQLQISASFVAFCRITTHILSIFFYLIALFLIQKCIKYLFVFLSLMGFTAVLFDFAQNVYIFKKRKNWPFSDNQKNEYLDIREKDTQL